MSSNKRIYSIAFTEEEYAALERIARKHGTRRSDIIRAAVAALGELADALDIETAAAEPESTARRKRETESG